VVALLESGRLRTWCLVGACLSGGEGGALSNSRKELTPGAVLRSGGGAAYSQVLFQASLWRSLAPASHVLVVQTDTWLCVGGGVGIGGDSSGGGRGIRSSTNSRSIGGGVYRRLVALAARFDFVGAPDSRNHWNGGLSLRNRTAMLEALKRFTATAALEAGPCPNLFKTHNSCPSLMNLTMQT
jgi:hypothetical protein